MRITYSNPGKLFVESKVPDQRNNKAVLFIPGGGLNYKSGTPIVDSFSEYGFASYSMSLRGHTGSYIPEFFEKTSLDDYVVDINAVLDKIAADQDIKHSDIHIIAHSLSAPPALKLARTHNIGSLILLAPVLTGEVHDYFNSDLTKAYNFPMPLNAFQDHLSENRGAIEELTAGHLEWFFGDGRDVSPYADILSVEPWQTRVDCFVNNYNVPVEDFSTDLMVLSGKKDPLMRVEGSRVLAKLYGGEFQEVDSSHMLMYDNWESSLGKILSFIK